MLEDHDRHELGDGSKGAVAASGRGRDSQAQPLQRAVQGLKHPLRAIHHGRVRPHWTDGSSILAGASREDGHEKEGKRDNDRSMGYYGRYLLSDYRRLGKVS